MQEILAPIFPESAKSSDRTDVSTRETVVYGFKVFLNLAGIAAKSRSKLHEVRDLPDRNRPIIARVKPESSDSRYPVSPDSRIMFRIWSDNGVMFEL
jgi:hypothetical protein